MPTIVTGEEYLTLPRAPETWVVEPLLPSGGSLLLYGDPKVGKSYAAIQLALAIQHSTEWLGFPVSSGGQVVYVQLDTPRSLWASRLEKLAAAGLPVASLHLADRETLNTFPFDILSAAHFEMLRSSLAELRPKAVIIDTIREAHGGEENDSTTMKAVLSRLVAATYPAALVLVAHARKAIGDVPNDLITDNRGSGYIVGAVDTILRFTKKRIYFTGRAIEEGHLSIERAEDGLWTSTGDQRSIDRHVASVLADTSLDTTVAKAKVLALRVNKSEEACRSLLRRAGA